MWSVCSALLLFHTVLRGFAQKPAPPKYLTLDMALNAVDDMYSGCKDQMDSKVRKEYLPLEKNRAQNNFTVAWRLAEKNYNKIWKGKKGKRPSTSLGKEQIMSIYMYTLDEPNVYIDFNNAVRTQGQKYKSSFKYHSLHYFLTSAIQKLNARRNEAERCVTGFRRVNGYFPRDVLNKHVRFGSFTSASLGWYPSAARFGDRSCFEITTCFGADISLFSKLGEAEREVLVPPYELFKVTQIKKLSENKPLPCQFVYMLSSTGVLSRLNCALDLSSSNHQKLA
ncbi:erythroblast NAD(P)(+)--arginine ADP-ribosyltransferase-like [Boleophthalmus pectinirostris]|uniref:erythroblast NAD(P)(+)--arginine ADP-ribosyltransferase-like n=1 Tax=Boleophthalmus pectinirostris TaxID=150288 RepID=UPI00242CE253|nr:erythroblast NAD(P)(+)--arginine ADP-ribosyltransferase-like [Boleophthalmus pectinirostris]XP_055014322.1 erythroblast NAD(P)(+)--arginine ADP-ribosyltransferase-like [Boleophthalmus pectinirostris]XP_055014323.1 erythroblast NAD(P)(+)--arginine ADP-ribosyltransferase-like [Boleophthalmus pectinirostris]